MAHFPPMPDETYGEDDGSTFPPVTVNHNQVTIGEVTLPGSWIQHRGVQVTVGDQDNINTVTVTFMVGSINVEDQCLPYVELAPTAH